MHPRHTPPHRVTKITQMVTWGEWMGGWKAGLAGEADGEAARIDRQKAAFGAETLAKLKDLNVLVVGQRGVGVEAAKNLILSNVGAVVVWDPEPTRMRDLGSNFYLTEAHAAAGTPRAEAGLPQLKSLNPYCKVEAYMGALSDAYILTPDVNATGKPFAAVVVTQLLPKADLFRINKVARENNIAFLMAITSGVTTSLFSDFGPNHLIMDKVCLHHLMLMDGSRRLPGECIFPTFRGLHGPQYPRPPLYKLRLCPSYSRRRDRINLGPNFNSVPNVVQPHNTWVL